MNHALVAALVLSTAVPVGAVKIDISLADIDRALTIARSRESERAQFHAPYISAGNSPFIEKAEVLTEFRRVVLMGEEHIARGDRSFAYSTSRASDALQVFRRRISIRVQVRFHPLNNYVTLPPVTMALAGNDGALIGVRRDPLFGSPAARGEPASLIGAVVEGSFEALALGQTPREFVVTLDKKELGRVAFDLSTVE